MRRQLGMAMAGVMVIAAAPAWSGSTATAAERPRVWVPTGDLASSSFVRVDQAATPGAEPSDLRLSGVRGGHLSAQLATTAPGGLEDLRVRVDGLPLGPDAVQVRFPEYVPNDAGGVIADPLRTADRVDVPAGEAQPIWLTVAIPRDAAPGTYDGRLTLTADGMRPWTRTLTVQVADVALPKVADRDYHLNLWFQPDTVAVEAGVPLWSDAHYAAMRPYLEDLAAHGQRVVNTAVADNPWPVPGPDGTWPAQTAEPFHSLVEWRYDGETWGFDFSEWDRFVRANLRAGVGPDIHAFGMLMFSGYQHLTYTDTRTGEVVDRELELGGSFWTEAWSAYLRAFEAHVLDQGWLDRTYLAFDERPHDQMQVAFDLIDEVAPVFSDQVAIAGSQTVSEFAYDLSINYFELADLSQDLIDQRRADGQLTTFYTYGGPSYPNTLTATPPFGARVLSWIVAQRDFDGYLRWSYNSWPEDVYADPSHRYVQGDEYHVYPAESPTGEPISSIRWELFRDGQEDEALLDLLAERAGPGNPTRQAALDAVDAHGAPTPEHHAALLNARESVIAELERFAAVRGRLSVDPAEIHQGGRTTATATFRNVTAGVLNDVTMRLPAPEGWTVEPLTSTSTDRLRPGERLVVEYAVRAAADADPGPTALAARVTASRGDQSLSWPLGARVEVAEPVAQVAVAALDRQARPGAEVPVSVTVTNPGTEPLESTSVALAVPDGWTGPSTADLGTIAPGTSAGVDLTVGVPEGATPSEPVDEHAVSAAATYGVGDRAERAVGAVDLLVVDPVDEGLATTEFAEAYLGQQGDRFEIHASGADLWGGTDEFAAIYRDDAVSDGAVVTTKVLSQTESWNYAKAGIMIRNDLATHSPGYVFLAVTPGHGFVMQYDSDGDGGVDQTVSTGTSGYPARLRLERDGATYTGSYSLDGTTWTEVGTVELPEVADVQDVGLFASAVNVFRPGVLSAVEYDGFAITDASTS